MSAKIAPNSEKNARLIDSEPMPKRGLRNRHRSSIGSARAQLPGHERGPERQRRAERAEDDRVQPAALGRLDDRVDERHQAGDREQRAGDVEAAGVGVAGSGTSAAAEPGRPRAARAR